MPQEERLCNWVCDLNGFVKGQILVTLGSLPVFLSQRTVEMAWTDLTLILAPIRWAVVGAAATRLYMPERVTRDLNVAIRVEDAQAARKKSADARIIYQGKLSIGGSTWRTPDGQ